MTVVDSGEGQMEANITDYLNFLVLLWNYLTLQITDMYTSDKNKN